MKNLKRALLILLLIFLPLIFAVAIGSTNSNNPQFGGLSVIFSFMAGVVCTALAAVIGVIVSLFMKRSVGLVPILPYAIVSGIFTIIAILYSISSLS